MTRCNIYDSNGPKADLSGSAIFLSVKRIVHRPLRWLPLLGHDAPEFLSYLYRGRPHGCMKAEAPVSQPMDRRPNSPGGEDEQ
jgi:hypothetical protein